ncbi:hypothetical protein ACHAXR_010929 [Thalassiosira sp. AJA248-18]
MKKGGVPESAPAGGPSEASDGQKQKINDKKPPDENSSDEKIAHSLPTKQSSSAVVDSSEDSKKNESPQSNRGEKDLGGGSGGGTEQHQQPSLHQGETKPKTDISQEQGLLNNDMDTEKSNATGDSPTNADRGEGGDASLVVKGGSSENSTGKEQVDNKGGTMAEKSNETGYSPKKAERDEAGGASHIKVEPSENETGKEQVGNNGNKMTEKSKTDGGEGGGASLVKVESSENKASKEPVKDQVVGNDGNKMTEKSNATDNSPTKTDGGEGGDASLVKAESSENPASKEPVKDQENKMAEKSNATDNSPSKTDRDEEGGASLVKVDSSENAASKEPVKERVGNDGNKMTEKSNATDNSPAKTDGDEEEGASLVKVESSENTTGNEQVKYQGIKMTEKSNATGNSPSKTDRDEEEGASLAKAESSEDSASKELVKDQGIKMTEKSNATGNSPAKTDGDEEGGASLVKVDSSENTAGKEPVKEQVENDGNKMTEKSNATGNSPSKTDRDEEEGVSLVKVESSEDSASKEPVKDQGNKMTEKSNATGNSPTKTDRNEEEGVSPIKAESSENTAGKELGLGKNEGNKSERAETQEKEVKATLTDDVKKNGNVATKTSSDAMAIDSSCDSKNGNIASPQETKEINADQVDTQNSLEVIEASVGSKGGDHNSAQEASGGKGVEDEDVSDSDFGAFGLLGKRKRKKRKKKSHKSKSLRISIPSHTPLVADRKEDAKDDVSFLSNCDPLADTFCFDDVKEEEDPLSFYSNTHEGQDPEYVEFHSSRLKNRLETELGKLRKAKEEDTKKIQTYISARWEERNDALQRLLNKVRVDMVAKQTRQRTQLSEKHKRQIEADERKIEEGEKWLIQKQQLELQQRMNQHQQMNLPNHGMVEWNAIAAQLQNRHAYQHQQFEEKKIEMKKRSEQELKAQNQILEAHHKKRQSEADTYIKELVDKCRKQQENLKAKLARLHEERFENRKKKIQADCTLTLDGDSHPLTSAQVKSISSKLDSEVYHEWRFENTPDLHVNHKAAKGGVHEGSISHDAVIRQKRRKGLMNNATIQLAIEIHNEGIIAMTKSNPPEGEKRASENDDKFSSDKSSGRSSVFIPWGAKARSFLYSIVIGEIPSGYFLDQIGRVGRGALGGGLVKCMITDTRTSDDTAISERSSTFVQVQLAKSKARVEDIERRYTSACATMSTLQAECTLLKEKGEKIAAAHKEAGLQFEKATHTLNKFKAQAQHFFNQDGTPSPRVNPDSQQKLLTAMHKYKSAFESTKNKEVALRQPLEIARNGLAQKESNLHKIQADVISLKKVRQSDGNAQDEENSLESIIENITVTLSKIAEKRRSQVNKNKSNSGFHQKMLRRRITTMLRPSHTTMTADVKDIAKRAKNSSSTNKDCFDICGDTESICPELRAEQLLLLALHPQSPNLPLPPVPDQSTPNQSWAEPGWQLIIDDPDFGEKSTSSILPIDTEGHLTQQFLSSCCSSGRQAASLIKPRHLRMLMAPLSFTCQASAPAETNPSGKKKASQGMITIYLYFFSNER